MTHGIAGSARRSVARRWHALWLLGLATCLFGRAARGVDLPAASHRDVLAVGFRYWEGVRWRDDDPDLVRAGAHARWEDALAEGARVVGERVVDLDGDGVAERVATVAPRADPAPQNTLTGIVILDRRSDGWRASVLFRPAWIADESARHLTPTATLTLRREGRRHRLVLAVELMNLEERPEGHGHEYYPQRVMMQLAWRGGRTVAEDLCHYSFTGPWRGARLDCAWIAGTEESARCEPHGRALSELDPRDLDLHDTRLPGWCRAEAAARTHDLAIEPAP